MSEAKKYKLIKEYPDSPKLGYIADFTDSNEVVYKEFMDNPKYDLVEYFIDISSCINYPEFWEEVVEEKLCVPIGTKFKYEGNKNFIYTIAAITAYDIEVTWIDSESKIKESVDYTISRANKFFRTGTWIECKPLFKTNDNVDIFEGDTFYFVASTNWGLGEMVASEIGQAKKAIARFSTKEGAEHYIKWTKPTYSATQVIETVADVLKEVGFIKSIALEVSQKIYSKLKLL